MEKKNSGGFTSGKVFIPLVLFMLPILLANLLQSMYGAADLLIIGRFETAAEISAVASGSTVTFTIQLVIAGLATGATVLIGRYLGEGRQEDIGKIIGSAIAIFTIFAVVLMIALYALTPAIVSALRVPQEAVEGAETYLRVCALGMVFTVAYNLISAIFRGLGNSVIPLIFVFIACVINVAGDLILVGYYDMGVFGVAIATVAAQAVSVVLFVIAFRFMRLPFAFKIRDISLKGEQTRGILSLGAPIALSDFLSEFSFLAIAAIVNSMGLIASSGYGVGTKLVGFIMLIPSALMQAISAFTAQNAGAGEHSRARRAMTYGIISGVAVGTLIFLATQFLGEPISEIFSPDPNVIKASADYLRGFGYDCILTCFLFGLMGFFNGYGKTIFVMAQNLACAFLVRMPLAFAVSFMADVGLWHIGFVTPVSSVFGIAACLVYYRVFSRRLKREALQNPA